MREFQSGSKLYQQRAQQALPLLVARAKAWRTFTYGQLAKKLGMTNPRNLNHVLGAIGNELKALGKQWKEKVPPIECIVINKSTKTPGRGIGFHMPVDAFKKLSPAARKQLLHDLNLEIWGYQKWGAVLKHFKLPPALPDPEVVDLARRAGYGHSGGESPEHLALKTYIAQNPHLLGLPKTTPEMEHRFGSGDEIDVLLKYPKEWVGIEVKGIHSDDLDLMRGIFQCVKYEALILAEQKLTQQTVGARMLLVISGALSPALRDAADLFGIKVCERVVVPARFAVRKAKAAATHA